MAAEPLLQAGRDRALAARADASSLSAFRQEQLAQVQRARILAGAIHVVGEGDTSNVAIAEIVQAAQGHPRQHQPYDPLAKLAGGGRPRYVVATASAAASRPANGVTTRYIA